MFILGVIRMTFLTSTRLNFDGKLSPKLEFHILIRNLLRRISLLSYFHCDRELELDFKGIIEKTSEVRVEKSNLTWFDWERYSNCQETTMRMGGFTGVSRGRVRDGVGYLPVPGPPRKARGRPFTGTERKKRKHLFYIRKEENP